jgi:hypothetical protein
MKVLVIDPKIAGISGDMLIAALVDLTGSSDPLQLVADAICDLSCCDNFSFQVNDVDAGGISAKTHDRGQGKKPLESHQYAGFNEGNYKKKLGFQTMPKQ